MEIAFHGRRALVTGAGKGIGREIAKALVKCGAETFALSRTQSDLDSLKAEVPGIHVCKVDLGNWEETKAVVQSVCPVDLLVNNAAIGKMEPIVNVTPENYGQIMEINVRSVVNVTQVVAKGMIERGKGGAIVNISGISSKVAFMDNMGMISASKAAVDSLTRTTARELGPHQIRCNTVNPTMVLTPKFKEFMGAPKKDDPMLQRTPLGRFAEIKDVVHPILYLLSDKADMITGATLNVDGGFLAC